MPIPATAIGLKLTPLRATVERGRVRFFAESIGETDPRYLDLDAARAAGHPDLLVPPTFFFGLKLDDSNPFTWLEELGVDLRYILHGTQRFEYTQLAFAGDELLLEPHVTEVYDKRGGALEFISVETAVTRGGEPVATMTETIIVRHPDPVLEPTGLDRRPEPEVAR